jgi:hypothetical protein
MEHVAWRLKSWSLSIVAPLSQQARVNRRIKRMHCVEGDLRFAYLKVIDYLLNTVDPTG